MINQNHSCDPTDFMTKEDCDRLHKEQRIFIESFMGDSKTDRSDIWRRHNELVLSVNDLVKTISARTIQILVSIVVGLVAFIVVVILGTHYSNQPNIEVMNALDTMNKSIKQMEKK